jgi:hypothetical protein
MGFRRFSAVAVGTIVLSAAAALAADGGRELLRVRNASEPPADARLKPRNLDNPAPFVPQQQFQDKAEWDKRAEFLRRQVLVANGLWPMPEKSPLNAVVHGKIEKDEYTVEKVFFASLPGHYVSGNLYRPKNVPAGAKVPGVLHPHGHWPNGRFMWRSDKDAKKEIDSGAEQTMDGARSPLQARAAMLARMGCVVFHYDMEGYADSEKQKGIVHRQGFTDVETVLRLQSQMGLQTWNSIRALDFITSLPEVDTSRIAVSGASGGGTQTFILCATDPRPAVAFPAVMVSMNMQGGCVCENAPLLRIGTNNVEIAATFAPKPQGMTAANDWTRDMETRGLPELRFIYKLFGDKMDERVTAKHFSFEHNYNQVSREMYYNFLNEHLKLGKPSPVKEKPFEAIPPEQLSVYDSTHPLPADAKDSAGVRKYWTATSDAQLADLAKEPEEYRKVVGGALRAMVADELPGRNELRVAQASGPRQQGKIVIEKGVIERADGDGSKVPYAAVFPREWDGRVVVWAHPDGKASLLGEGGGPSAEVRRLLDAKAAVVSADLFLTGEFNAAGKGEAPWNPTAARNVNPEYAAFTLGYNRSVLANRVHDLLSVIALARGWEGTKSVRVIGVGKAGPCALLARAVAGDAVEKAAVDLNGFDFDAVKAGNDEMMLPGALKYGGIYGFVPLCTSGETRAVNAKKGGQWDLGAKTKGVTLEEKEAETSDLVEWLVK